MVRDSLMHQKLPQLAGQAHE